MSMSQKQPHRRNRPPNVGVDVDDDRRKRSQSSRVKRRRQAAVSIASFSSKRGHDRAIQEYKKRKDEKFQKNAALLREYHRAMRAEGYEAGRGASRKRVATSSSGGEEEDIEGEGAEKCTTDDAEEGEERPRKKWRKVDPLYRARKEAKWRKAEREKVASEKEQRQKTESQKQQDRKTRSRNLMKRTRRGQPVMKNVIGDMLEKIKREAGNGGEG